jgi:hypothetical protein
MPIFREGNFFKVDGFKFFAANSYLTKDLRLVMEKEAAQELKIISPGIDKIFGNIIHRTCGNLGLYGLIKHDLCGIFQVKYSFREKANLNPIRFSTIMLSIVSKKINHIVHLNYPGIDNGELSKEDVRPILDVLPDNVHIWVRKENQSWLTRQN